MPRSTTLLSTLQREPQELDRILHADANCLAHNQQRPLLQYVHARMQCYMPIVAPWTFLVHSFRHGCAGVGSPVLDAAGLQKQRARSAR